jgi:hypothetical protein
MSREMVVNLRSINKGADHITLTMTLDDLLVMTQVR